MTGNYEDLSWRDLLLAFEEIKTLLILNCQNLKEIYLDLDLETIIGNSDEKQ